MFHILQILSPPSSSRNSNSCSWPVGFSRVFSLTISDAYGGNCWDKSHSWKLWLMLHLSQTRSSRHSLALHLYHLHHLHMQNIHWTNFQISNCKRENPLSTCVETTFLTRVIFLRPRRLCIVSLYSQLRLELLSFADVNWTPQRVEFFIFHLKFRGICCCCCNITPKMPIYGEAKRKEGDGWSM